jgi:hypothetical protein
MLNAVRTMPQKEAIEVITAEMLSLSQTKLDDETATGYAKRIYRELEDKSLKRTEIQYAIIESRIELPREGFSENLAKTIIANAKEKEFF